MKNDKNHTEIDFWQSNTDLMSAFALMMLLLIMLLILYLMQIPENISADGEANQGFLVDDELGDRTIIRNKTAEGRRSPENIQRARDR